jgi:hypothetical protein
MAAYIGATPVPQSTQHRESFNCTSGQVSFATAGYTPQFIDVYLNGIKLAGEDYTATNGSDVVLAAGAATGDILEYVAYTPFEVADQTFTGTTTVDVLNVSGPVTIVDGINGRINIGAATNYLYGDSSGNVIVGNAGGDRMQVDSAGRVTTPYQPAFVAKFSATRSNTVFSPMIFDAVGYNIGGHYNGTTGIFTAPVAGRYQFNVMALRQSGGSSYLNLKVAINGAAPDHIYGTIYTNDLTGENGISGSWVVNLATNDQFAIWYGSSSTVTFYATETAMSGILIG